MDQPSMTEKTQNDMDIFSRHRSAFPHQQGGHSGAHHHETHHHRGSHSAGESHHRGGVHHHGGPHYQDSENPYSYPSHHRDEAHSHGRAHGYTSPGVGPLHGTVRSQHSYGEDQFNDEHHYGGRMHHGGTHHRGESHHHGGGTHHHGETYHRNDSLQHGGSQLHTDSFHHGGSHPRSKHHHYGGQHHHMGAYHPGEDLAPNYYGESHHLGENLSQYSSGGYYHHGEPPHHLYGVPSHHPHGEPPHHPYGVPPHHLHGVPSHHPHGEPPHHPHGEPPHHPHGVPPHHLHGVPSHHPHGEPPHHPHGEPPHHPHGVPPHHLHGVPSHHPHGVPPHHLHGVPSHHPHGVPPHHLHGVPSHHPHGEPPYHPHGEPPYHLYGVPSHHPHGESPHHPYGVPSHHLYGVPSHHPRGVPFHHPHGVPHPYYAGDDFYQYSEVYQHEGSHLHEPHHYGGPHYSDYYHHQRHPHHGESLSFHSSEGSSFFGMHHYGGRHHREHPGEHYPGEHHPGEHHHRDHHHGEHHHREHRRSVSPTTEARKSRSVAGASLSHTAAHPLGTTHTRIWGHSMSQSHVTFYSTTSRKSSKVHPRSSKDTESWSEDEHFQKRKLGRTPRAHRKMHSADFFQWLWDKLSYLIWGFRKLILRLTQSLAFETFIFLIVCLNSIMLVAQTFAEVEIRGEWYFLVLDCIFLCIYVMEALLKIIALGLAYFYDFWNNLDFFIMLMAVLDFVLMQINSLSFSFYNHSLFRILKVFKSMRALRAIRVLRRLSILTSLQEVTGTLGHSLPSIVAILTLMFTCLFLFSVVLRALFRKSDPKRFQNIFTTIFTLFTLLTLDDWSLIYMDSRAQGAWYIIPILMIYIIIQYFIFLNLVIAVLVDNFQIALLKGLEKVKQEKAARVQEKLLEDSLTELRQSEPEEIMSETTLWKQFIDRKFGAMTDKQRELQFQFLQLVAGVEHQQQRFRSQACVIDEIVDTAFEAGEEDFKK